MPILRRELAGILRYEFARRASIFLLARWTVSFKNSRDFLTQLCAKPGEFMISLRTGVLIAVALIIGFSHPSQNAVADDRKLEGKWKLVVFATGEDEFVVFEVTDADGKLSGDTVAAQKNIFASPKI